MVSVPPDFAEDVERAARGRHRGDLLLYADEVATLEWGQAGLRLIREAESRLGAELHKATTGEALLFTGHMVDAPDREKSRMRFPPTPEAERAAWALIEHAVKAEIAEGGRLIGIAGGACGSDILFHVVCDALGVETQLFLALPRSEFRAASVERGGPRWVERYERLCDRLAARVLQRDEALPNWLAGKPDYDVWQRNNQWMLFNTLAADAHRKALIALYNQSLDSDGPGGTKHLVELARRCGFKSVELDARALLPNS